MIGDGGAARAKHMLGNYEILETLGTGGMGVVYRAYDHTLGRTVALKVLRDDLRVQAHLVSRFQREARAVAALDHPNIVQVFSVGAIDQIPYIAMEFVEGRPLNKILKKNGQLGWEQALRLASQVAQGLAAAQDKGIYHRDIKPGNILIDSGGRAYLTDFGIAKVMNAETQLTVDGSRLGTPHYMAPERCEGTDAGNLSDIYSIGVVLHQMLTATLPFDAETPAGLIEQILAKPIPRVSKFRDDIPRDVDRLVAWMTEKDPRHRPHDAHQLAEAIDRVAAGMPLEEEGPNLAGALAEFRESVTTPTPVAGSDANLSSARFREHVTKLYAGWKAWPYAAKLGGSVLAAACIAFAIAFVIAAKPPADYAAAIAQQPDMGLSRWEAPGAVGQFFQESPGVYLVALNTPGFVPDIVAASADSVFILLNGAPETNRSNEQMVVAIQPDQGDLTLVRAPSNSANGVWDDITVSWRGDGWFLRHVDGQLVMLPFAGQNSSRILGGNTNLTTAPGLAERRGDSLYVAVEDNSVSGANWQLAQLKFGPQSGGAIRHALTRHGPPIRDIRVDPLGEWIVYARSLENEGQGQAIHVVKSTARSAPEKTLATGTLSLPEHAIHPAGEYAALIQQSDHAPAILVAPLSEDREVVEIAGAVNATWSNDGEMLYVIAPDVYGKNQVWAMRVGDWSNRQQYTFLTGGVEMGTLVPAGSAGALAITPLSQKPTFVWVDGSARRDSQAP